MGSAGGLRYWALLWGCWAPLLSSAVELRYWAPPWGSAGGLHWWALLWGSTVGLRCWASLAQRSFCQHREGRLSPDCDVSSEPRPLSLPPMAHRPATPAARDVLAPIAQRWRRRTLWRVDRSDCVWVRARVRLSACMCVNMCVFHSTGGCCRCPECRAWLALGHNGYDHGCTENTTHKCKKWIGSRLACGHMALLPLRRCGHLARPLEGVTPSCVDVARPRQTSACAPRKRAGPSLCPTLLQPFRCAKMRKLGCPRPYSGARDNRGVSARACDARRPQGRPVWLQLGRAAARSLSAPRPASR